MGHTNPPTTRTSPPAQATPRRGIRGEAVALLRMAQAGDRDAFGQLFLLTELPSAVQSLWPRYLR